MLLLLLSSATLTSCASRSTPIPVVTEAPKLQPLPVEISGAEPPPSGSYSRELTEQRAEWRELLTSTPTN